MDQAAPQAQALFHAFRQRGDVFLTQPAELAEIHHVAHRTCARHAVQTVGAGEEVEVLPHRHVGISTVAVRHVADHAAHLVGIIDGAESTHRAVARRRQVERGKNAHGGGFARAVRADEAKDLAGIETETDVAYGVG